MKGGLSVHVTDRWGETRVAALWLADRIRTDGARALAVVCRDGRTIGELLTVVAESFAGLYPIDVDHRGMSVHMLDTGARIQFFHASVPEKIRGVLADAVWCHRPATWPSLRAWEAARDDAAFRKAAFLITD